ncbi:V-type ATP synthase subunit D [subsurface metagenome]
MLPAYSFENTSHYLDDLIILLIKFFQSLIIVAQSEDLLLKLSQTFKKINRRINGLKNVIIPELQIDIKKIKAVLEEIERENYVRLKNTKNLIIKNA